MPSGDPRILARIEKIARLMNSANPGEAAAARDRYEAMCRKYGIGVAPSRPGQSYSAEEWRRIEESREDARDFHRHQRGQEIMREASAWLLERGFRIIGRPVGHYSRCYSIWHESRTRLLNWPNLSYEGVVALVEQLRREGIPA